MNAVTQLTVRLEAEDIRRLEEFSDKECRTLAESVRYLIRKHLPPSDA